MFNLLEESFVLIEPYWNVKNSESRMKQARETVLIEPYWNVKKEPLGTEFLS